MFFQLFGGIGLFLLGMILLTEGLKAFAGDSLRKALLRFTGKPWTSFLSGMTVTALVQSSSATTLMTIGFVSAGLLSFGQTVGVVFGASLGTTGTGWIVSTVGLKFSIGAFALPLTAVGAFLRLLGRGRISSAGLALAGFGLIFIGIDTLQAGMSHLAETFDLGRIPRHGLFAKIILLLIGAAMTVVMQSSSAAIATTLAALHTGAIGFEQAMPLAIGQAIGTTVTAGIAVIGATTAAKRTALAHILFNAATGVIALLMLPLYQLIFARYEGTFGQPPGAVALAAFHTTFIAVGVLVFLPFSARFARFIERLLPEKKTAVTRYLDGSLLLMPSVATEAARNALREVAARQIYAALDKVRLKTSPTGGVKEPFSNAESLQSMEEIRRFLARIPLSPGEEKSGEACIALFHALDHLTQLANLPLHSPAPSPSAHEPVVRSLADGVVQVLEGALNALREEGEAVDLGQLESQSREVADLRRKERVRLLNETGGGKLDAEATLRMLDWIRAMDSSAYHAWRAAFYLRSNPGTGEE